MPGFVPLEYSGIHFFFGISQIVGKKNSKHTFVRLAGVGHCQLDMFFHSQHPIYCLNDIPKTQSDTISTKFHSIQCDLGCLQLEDEDI